MGPSQICGCPFREPRVFEIAHICLCCDMHVQSYTRLHGMIPTSLDGDGPARLGPGFAPKISHDTHEITGFPFTSHVLSLSQNWIIRAKGKFRIEIN